MAVSIPPNTGQTTGERNEQTSEKEAETPAAQAQKPAPRPVFTDYASI